MKKITIDSVEYELRNEFDFLEKRALCFKCLETFKDVIKINNTDGKFSNFNIDLGAILKNISEDKSGNLNELQEYILKHSQAVINGQTILFKDSKNVNKHFSEFQEHYFALIVAGIQYYFLPIYKGITKLSLNIPFLSKIQE